MTKALRYRFWPTKKNAALSKTSNNAIDYLDGIIRNDPTILKAIYDENLSVITQFVLKNSGTKDDARDVLQDGLIVIYKKIKSGNLELTASFGTYLFSVCRFVWLKELKKKHRQSLSLDNVVGLPSSVNLEKEWNENEQQKLFRSKMKQLTQEEQDVLTLFFNGEPMKSIANKMNYTLAYAQRKKYLAKNKLMKLVRKDPLFKELK